MGSELSIRKNRIIQVRKLTLSFEAKYYFIEEKALKTQMEEINFIFSFDTDITTRHTVWTMIVGGYFTWISVYGINQTQVQRYLTVNEKSKAVK